jgi:hypothetical protein
MLASMLMKKKSIPVGSYQYVRLNHMTALSAAYNCVTMSEIQIIDSNSATNWCRQSGAIASASGYYHDGINADQLPQQAIDGLIDSAPAHRWTSNVNGNATNFSLTPFWWMVNFGQPRAFDSIKIALLSGNGQDPVHFTIEGSNDGTNFTQLKEVIRGAYTTNVLTEVLAT